MPLRISAFPKCYLDQIAGKRSMSVFEWIEMAKSLDADGLEMYEGFFTSMDPGYLDSVAEAIHEGMKHLLKGEEGRAVVELFTAIYESSRTGRAQSLFV